MADTHNINLYGVDLIIEGNYSKGTPSDCEYPGDPDEFEITKVNAEGDISELLDYFGNESVLEKLQKEILEKFYR